MVTRVTLGKNKGKAIDRRSGDWGPYFVLRSDDGERFNAGTEIVEVV